jgi:hypothetical protein
MELGKDAWIWAISAATLNWIETGDCTVVKLDLLGCARERERERGYELREMEREEALAREQLENKRWLE